MLGRKVRRASKARVAFPVSPVFPPTALLDKRLHHVLFRALALWFAPNPVGKKFVVAIQIVVAATMIHRAAMALATINSQSFILKHLLAHR